MAWLSEEVCEINDVAATITAESLGLCTEEESPTVLTRSGQRTQAEMLLSRAAPDSVRAEASSADCVSVAYGMPLPGMVPVLSI